MGSTKFIDNSLYSREHIIPGQKICPLITPWHFNVNKTRADLTALSWQQAAYQEVAIGSGFGQSLQIASVHSNCNGMDE